MRTSIRCKRFADHGEEFKDLSGLTQVSQIKEDRIRELAQGLSGLTPLLVSHHMAWIDSL